MPMIAVLTSIYVLVFCLVNDLRVTMTSPELNALFGRWIYYATHARMGSWFVGMTLGFILYNLKSKTVAISKGMNVILWILAIGSMVTVMLLSQPLNVRVDNQTHNISNAFYIAFHRLLWAISISWIVFACHKLQTGGIIRWFLSLPQWQPIGRMSLSLYLIHVFYQATQVLNQKEPFTWELFSIVCNLFQ